MASQQFGVGGTHDRSLELSALVLPACAGCSVPSAEIRLCRPLAPFLEVLHQPLGGLVVGVAGVERSVFQGDVELTQRRQPRLILLRRPYAGVQGPARVASEACRSPAPVLELLRNMRVAKHETQPPELIVDQRVHGVQHEGAHRGTSERGGTPRSFDRELRQDREEERLGLAGASSSRNDEVAAVGDCRLDGARLMTVGRVVSEGPPVGSALCHERQQGACRCGDVEILERRSGHVARGALEERFLEDDADLLE